MNSNRPHEGADSNGTSKVNYAHEHPSLPPPQPPPQQQQLPLQRQPAPAHSCASSSSSSSNKPRHKSQPAATNPMNLSTSPPHSSHNNGNSSAQIAINNANSIAAAAATLLSQAAASFLSHSVAPAAHQNSPPSANSSFNIANIIGKTNDLPREAHGRVQPQQRKHSPSPTKSSTPNAAADTAAAVFKSVIADSAARSAQSSLFAENAVLEAIAMAMAVGGFPTTSPPHAHSSRLPQQAKSIHSPPTSPSSHMKQQNHHHHHHHNSSPSSHNISPSQVASSNNVAHNSKKISVKTAAKKAPTQKQSVQVYDFEGNNRQKGTKRESKSPIEGPSSQKIVKKTVPSKPTIKVTSSVKKPVINGSSHRPSNSHSHHSSPNSNQNRRRKLLREQDDEECNGLENGQAEADHREVDEWVENTQPFVNKVYLKFDWRFPTRKPDNPFVNHSSSGGGNVSFSRSVSNHRTLSPNNGGPVIMKAPKAMMKKSGKRRSK